jgi:signal transduction histidine kinase
MSARGGTLSVSAARDGDRVRVDVRDTGPGIQPEYLPRLFDPFFTTRANGSGLGLYSVKRIVEEHHGEIKIQSKLGRGTCFSLWLPTAESVAERVDTD